jgi:hypothetical protein
MNNKKEGGNVLFLILIAVALFSALSYIVTKSSRSGSGSVNKEKFGILVSQLTQFPIAVRAGVVRLATTEGGNENVSFDWEGWGNTNYQHTPVEPDKNKVFHPLGAGVPFQEPDQERMLDRTATAQPGWGNWLFTGSTCIPGIGTGDDATCNADPNALDMVAFLPYITLELCREVNVKMKVNLTNNGQPPVDQGNAWRPATPEYVGTYTTGEALIDTGNLLYGKDAACFEGGGTPPAGTYTFYMTLIHR